jgi:hypothetical protein
MKINDYKLQKHVNNVMSEFSFEASHAYLSLLSYPDPPSYSINDLKNEARDLLYNMLVSVAESDGQASVSVSDNFKAFYIFEELHLDMRTNEGVSHVPLVDLIGDTDEDL